MTSQTPLPPDSQYATIKNGHLTLNGKPVRYWGAIGAFPTMPDCAIEVGSPGYKKAIDRARRENELGIQRLSNLGFNMFRLWEVNPGVAYTKGDGSIADMKDFAVHQFKEKGMKLWGAGPANRLGIVTESDVDCVDDSRTASAWQEAIRQASKEHFIKREGYGNRGRHYWPKAHGAYLRNFLPRIWDPRLETIGIQRLREAMDHVNQYTGLAWGDDPVFAVWELSNEEWWFGRMVSGRWQTYPEFFQKSLLAKWNDWLWEKYGSQAQLRARWLGLFPGESLEDRSIMLVPLRSEVAADPQRMALGIDVESGVAQTYCRKDCNAHRASDVIDFLTNLWIGHKRRTAEAFKQMGKSCRLSPLVWDTGIGYEIQSQYMQQHGDATCHCTYLTGFHHDPTHRRFPWFSGLEELPRLCWQVRTPWVEQNRMPDKPQFIYETQMEQPSKYRTEYPLRVAALGSIQDWDIVCWHTLEHFPDLSQSNALEKPMDYMHTEPKKPNQSGFQYRYDEVYLSAMQAAGEVFKNRLLESAPDPTTYIFGRNSLFDPTSLDDTGSYGAAGETFISTVYRHGIRLLIDDNRDDNEIKGSVVKPRQYESSPVRPTDQITYDWQHGFLRCDSPSVAAFSGFLGQYPEPVISFSTGIILRDVTVENPPDIAYPVSADEKYITFVLASTDGLPLELSGRIIISLVSTSFNQGFRLDHNRLRREFVWNRNEGAIVNQGGTPVQVARVGASIEVPMMTGRHYRMYDWYMDTLEEGVVETPVLRISAQKPVYLLEIKKLPA